MSAAADWLSDAGIAPHSVVDFNGEIGPRHVRYLDLVAKSGSNHSLLPDAVVESGGVPLIYVLRHDTLGSARADSAELATLLRVLACRADARHLAIFEPGQVTVYPIRMDLAVPAPVLCDHAQGHYSKLRGLLNGNLEEHVASAKSRKATTRWLDDVLFTLLSDAGAWHSCSSAGSNDSTGARTCRPRSFLSLPRRSKHRR